MDILKLIDEETILIMPSTLKTKVLKDNKRLLSIKSFTKQELQKKILFDYDEETINYVIKTYNLKTDVAIMYLKNMYYIDESNYDSPKLNKLSMMKKDLDSHELLKKDKFFLNSLSGMKIVVYGYDHIDKFFKKLLDIISDYANVEVIENKEVENKDIKVYEFDDIEDEINFIAYSICDLIKSGVDINNIKLGNMNSDYMIPLSRIFSFYKIPVNLNNNIGLYGTDMVLLFVDLFRENHSLKYCLDKLSQAYNLSKQTNLDIYNKLVIVCNKYIWYNPNADDILDMLISDLKNAKTNIIKITNAVEIVDLKNTVELDAQYVFVMSFNQGSMPVIYKNEDYITDDLKNVIDIETTYEKNVIENLVCSNIIKRLSNPIITYKLKTKTSQYYPSSLIDTLGATIISNPKTNINMSYSVIQDGITLSKKLDKLVKYDELDDDIDVLYSNYQDTLYKTYDNKFKGINNDHLIEYLSPKLKISYSSIDDYFKCAFKYYINSVMKFRSREETFYLTIGTLFHAVLAHAFEPDFNFDMTWSTSLKDKELSSKENFFLLKLKEELKFIIKVIGDHNELSTLDKALYEEKIYVNLPNKIDVTFSGIVDKIMYKEDNNTLVSLVDYKTGNADININNVIHGLNMQLPIYLYLVSNSDKFNNPIFVGFYLQEILHNEIYNDNTKDYETKKQDALKLKGYTLDQEDMISKFDASYKDSRVIKSMKISSKGFYAYSKIISDSQTKQLIDLISDKIDEATNNILSGNFDITPKKIGGTNVACEYCEFKDMCYMKDSDVITLKEYKYSDFLGGESNE